MVYSPGSGATTSSAFRSRLDGWFYLLSFAIPVLLSLPLLGTDYTGGEYAEYLLGAKTLGIVRFPGFPLYLLTVHAFQSLLPWGNWVWKAEFASLVFGALTASLIFGLGRRLRFAPVVSLAASWLFFFSPFVWQEAVVPRHFTFHLFLLAISLYLTLRLIGHRPRPMSPLSLMVWAGLCGASGGQHFALLPWSLTALVLGLTLGMPRQRTVTLDTVLAVIGFMLGAFLPYLYLPWRMLSPQAFVNPDAALGFAGARSSLSLLQLSEWLWFYLRTGIHHLFAAHEIPAALQQLAGTLALFVGGFPFLGLVMVALGFFFNVRDLLVRQPARFLGETDVRLRLILALLPILALLWQFTLLPARSTAALLGLSLAGALWSLRGLEYAYYELGRQPAASAKKFLRPHPAWFGFLVVILVPALALLHSFAPLRRTARSVESDTSNLARGREFLEAFPPGACLTFASAESSFGLETCQRLAGIRPDIRLMPFSRPWRTSEDPEASLTATLARARTDPFSRHLAFFLDWSNELARVLDDPDTAAYFVARPLIADTALNAFLQSFMLAPAYAPLAEWERPGTLQRFPVYRIQPPATSRPEPVAVRDPPLAVFDGRLALQSLSMPRPVRLRDRLALLRFTLHWKLLRPFPADRPLLHLWIRPARGPATLPFLDGRRLPWKDTRILGKAADWSALRTGQGFTDTLQLAVPATLERGRYVIYIGILDVQTDELLPAELKTGRRDYFVPAGEFWVVDRDSVSSSR